VTLQIQGKTIPRLILDLNHYPYGRLTHAMLLVGLTKVRDIDHIRILPRLPGQTQDHLLKPDVVMLAWMAGFNAKTGTWSEVLAHNAHDEILAALRCGRKTNRHASSAQLPQHTKPATVPPSARATDSDPSKDQGSKSAASGDSSQAKPSGNRWLRNLTPSLGFKIASQGLISNMKPFGRSAGYRSFKNGGGGDCLFESFKQALELSDTVLNMRRHLVDTLAAESSPDKHAHQLNEHVLRELDAHNERYMGFGLDASGGYVITEANVNTPLFQQLHQQYSEDMLHHRAYAGQAETVVLANRYGVNVTVWAHNRHRRRPNESDDEDEPVTAATHVITHLQSPPAHRTMHLLCQNNIHYEATNIPNDHYPIPCAAPSTGQGASTRSGSLHPSRPLPPALLPILNNAAEAPTDAAINTGNERPNIEDS
jgi:hypothetical protein